MTAQKLELGVSLLAEPKASYPSSSTCQQWVEVLVDCPGAQGLYTYRIPKGLEVQSGDILNVPFGAQQVGAIALRLLHAPPSNLEPAQIREIQEVVSHHFFPTSYWTLLQRVATYYYTPFIQVIRAALPAGLLARSQRRIRLAQQRKTEGGSPREENHPLNPAAQQLLQLLTNSKTGDYTWQHLQRQVPKAYGGLRELLQRGLVESYLEPAAPVRPKLRQAVTLTATTAHNEVDLSTRQREILQVLRRQGGDVWLSDLLQLCKSSSAPLKALEQKGYLVIQAREVLRSETGVELQPDQPKTLMTAQAEALASIQSLSGTAQVLLHGVTGSGKTEVYLQAIAPVLQRGQSALVLVPEIGLTPQLTDRFRARFGSQVCVYHSALSEGERYDTWRLMLNDTPKVVIGTRSAVFSPLPHLGLIILDEEHDPSFKQEQPAPCYHARTVAQWRAELENCPLILGSATPSLESWVSVRDGGGKRKAERDRNREEKTSDSSLVPHPSSPLYLSLPDRIHARPLPPVEVVDMRQELQQGNHSIFSRSLQTALEELQERKQQGILFIHRRGFSTFVSCRSCGYVLDCPNCDVSLAYHHTHSDAQKLLRCHYCNYTCLHPSQCPHCGSPYLKFFGSGTQRVAQELTQHLPDLRLLRFDSDTTRTKGSHRALLTRFANGEADLLIGTQMLTKGIDLPQVTLVGVVAADGLLHLADYRASERSFQTLTQVAGRAGRGEEPGRVILQTYTPHHPVIQAVQGHDYQTFVEAELAQRSSLHYPPYGKLLLVRLSSPEPTAVQQAATRVAHALTPPETENPTYELLGPAPATIFRVARRYRWQILLKLLPNATLNLPDVAELRSLCPGSVSLTIDVDPLSF